MKNRPIYYGQTLLLHIEMMQLFTILELQRYPHVKYQHSTINISLSNHNKKTFEIYNINFNCLVLLLFDVPNCCDTDTYNT